MMRAPDRTIASRTVVRMSWDDLVNSFHALVLSYKGQRCH
jgi:hypothetical protein